MHVDVISDTVCPWCYIGKRRLERAMAMRPDLEFSITWRAYQLNPDMPLEGKDRNEHYQAKFGSLEKTAQITKTITDLGAEDDLDLAFDKIERMPNTLASHRLARWAASAGCQDAVIEGLFRAYFTEGRDIGDVEVLLEVAESASMDIKVVRDLLNSDADEEMIKEEDALARQMGITGVPCFIFDQKFPLMGAQEPEAFLQIFEAVIRADAITVAEP
ncbi:MAG TPA: DsbA family oxidoreductase, partial [Sneathiellales bacterium]|nr:DsbA family oxidoreductase [Sneathiellales bacterium]